MTELSLEFSTVVLVNATRAITTIMLIRLCTLMRRLSGIFEGILAWNTRLALASEGRGGVSY